MDETAYYHAIAVAARGNYSAVKKWRGGAQSWKVAFAKLKKKGEALPDPDRSADDLARCGVRLILAEDDRYPERLRHIAQPPFGLYVRGDGAAAEKALINPLSLAIVGTRRASSAGKRTAHDFAAALARAGFTIASGLAFGIDAAAHQGCVDAGGATVAVLAGGLDRIYPGSHEALARNILAHGGAIVSEYPPGEEPFSYRFIERNRLMSGLARGVLVVEAPAASGALATAHYAADQDRDLFVVPGDIAAPGFVGSNSLIRQGAELVRSPDDILSAYGIAEAETAAIPLRGDSPEEALVLQALQTSADIIDVDKLVVMTKLEPRIVNRTLTFLIMKGIIKESDGGYTI